MLGGVVDLARSERALVGSAGQVGAWGPSGEQLEEPAVVGVAGMALEDLADPPVVAGQALVDAGEEPDVDEHGSEVVGGAAVGVGGAAVGVGVERGYGLYRLFGDQPW